MSLIFSYQTSIELRQRQMKPAVISSNKIAEQLAFIKVLICFLPQNHSDSVNYYFS